MGQTGSRTHHTGRARETVRGTTREAQVGLSTGCARFSEIAKRLTIGEVQLCRRKPRHMRSRGFLQWRFDANQVGQQPQMSITSTILYDDTPGPIGGAAGQPRDPK